jgi:hypothetical protein
MAVHEIQGTDRVLPPGDRISGPFCFTPRAKLRAVCERRLWVLLCHTWATNAQDERDRGGTAPQRSSPAYRPTTLSERANPSHRTGPANALQDNRRRSLTGTFAAKFAAL